MNPSKSPLELHPFRICQKCSAVYHHDEMEFVCFGLTKEPDRGKLVAVHVCASCRNKIAKKPAGDDYVVTWASRGGI